MTEHLGYQGKHITVTEDLIMVLGMDKTYTFIHELGAAAAVKEAYFMVENSAGTVVVSLNKADHAAQWDFSTTNECTLTLTNDETEDQAAGDYYYGIVLVDQSDLKHEPQMGKFTLLDGRVVAQGTAPHETWTTASARDAQIDTLESQLSGMSTVFDFSWLTAAATAGATTLSVSNGSLFSVPTPVTIELDAGTYASKSATAATASSITISVALGGAAAKYNIVRVGP